MITLDSLTVAYRNHVAVNGLSGSFERGSLTAIVGPNGAGKSSLLSALVGRIPITAGSIQFDNSDRDQIAYLPQLSEINRSFPIRVTDVVMLGYLQRHGLYTAVDASMYQQAADALKSAGLTGFEHRLIADLSVGQFQRVLFARVLLQDAPIILLDEPFAAIDARTTDDLLQLLQRWHEQGRTVIAVLHDMEQVVEHFPETLLIARELIAWGATAETLTTESLVRARHQMDADIRKSVGQQCA